MLGVTDANVGLTVGQKLRDLLEAEGATVIMTRDTDIRVGFPNCKTNSVAEALLVV